MLPEFDIFVAHNNCLGISKSVLESLLSGLPCITNQRNELQVSELQGDFIYLVINTVDGYYHALKNLLDNDILRESLGRSAFAHSRKHWSSEKTEAKYVEIYKKFI